MDENASFLVNEKMVPEYNTSLGQSSQHQPPVKIEYESETLPQASGKPENSNKKEGKLRKCKCLLKRMSKVFRKDKDDKDGNTKK